MQVVYIDVLFLLNFLVDYLLLLVSARFSGRPVRRRRLLAAAGVGGLYSAAVFFPGLSLLSSISAKILISLAIVAIAFPFSGITGLIRASLSFFAVSLVLAGGMVLASSAVGSAGVLRNGVPYLNLSLKVLFFSAACCYFLLGVVFRRLGRRRSAERVIRKLFIRFFGKSASVSALCDTGCEITDPVTGLPALICASEALSPLFSPEIFQILTALPPADALEKLAGLPESSRFRLLPFRTVSDTGLMLAFRPDEISDESGSRLESLVAFSPRPIDSENGYQAVITPF